MSNPQDRERERAEKARRLKDDLEYFARHCLKIRVKKPGGEDGAILPLVFNASQRYLHQRIEDQRRRKGRVRMLVLKGRQVGISTYIGARYYHRTAYSKGIRTFILTHEDKATDNLFGMVQRFHDNCPEPVRAPTEHASAKELSFARMDSGYKVGTAGSRAGIGRSDTIQLFHGSEMGFWPNAEDHDAGIGQAIADADGTEDIRESTANGIGGAFHSLWVAAEQGKSGFECCFIPWFVHEEYAVEPPRDWVEPEKFCEYAEVYKLTRAQIHWAWLKNRDLQASTGSDPDTFSWKFKQEYPANAAEAFQVSGENHFIAPEVVLKARKRLVSGYGPIVLGVDPSRGGSDMMGIVDRQGRRMGGHVCERYKTSRDMRANAGHVVQVVKNMRAQGLPLKKVCIDCTDGGGLYDMVRDQLGDDLIVGVQFGEAAYDADSYANRRAEMGDLYRQWFDDPVGVQVPDDDAFQRDACCMTWGSGRTHHRPNGQLVLEPKEKIREKIKVSPDLGFDAAALTFAVDYSELKDPSFEESPGNRLGAHGWMA